MSDTPETSAFPYTVEVNGIAYTVLPPEGEPGYRVRLPDGGVTAFPAHSGDPSPDNAEGDIAHALANPPAPPVSVVALTPLTILGRLTPAEEAALSGSTDLAVAIVRNRLIAASEVRSDDPRTAGGAAILVSKSIITAERAAEIFPL
jgi:hypothetical protein